MDINTDNRLTGGEENVPENGGKDEDAAQLSSIMRAAYKNSRLMSILSENLMYCNDIGAALYAVSTGNEKDLLETLRH